MSVKSLSLVVLGTPVTLSLSLVEGEIFELTTSNNSSVLYDLEKEKFEMDYGWLEDALKNFETNEESAINSLFNTGIVFGKKTYEEARIFDKLNFIDRNLLGDMCVDLQKEIKKEELPSDAKEIKIENKNEKGEIKMEKTTRLERAMEGNKNLKEGVSMSRREFLKERAISEVLQKNLDKETKLLTNFTVNNQEKIEKAFSDLLELAMGNVNGFSYQNNVALTDSLIMGKKESFEKSNATNVASLLIGSNKRVKDAFINVLLEDKEKLNIPAATANEQIKFVNSNIFPSEQNKNITIVEMELFQQIKEIANKGGMDLAPTGEIRKGYTVGKLIDQTDKNVKLEIIIPEVYTIKGKHFSTGVDHRLIKVGNDLYAGSATVNVKNTLTKKYSNEELIYGKFFDSIDNYFNIVTEMVENKYQIEDSTFGSKIFFNPKEDSEFARAFFLRVGAVNEIFSTKNTYTLAKKMKFERLAGTMIKVNPLAYTAYVLSNLDHNKADELFNTMEGFTLGGGAGISSIFYKTVNNLQRTLITAEDRVRANAFTLNPFVAGKGSRMNNSDSYFLNQKYILRMRNHEGFEIPWNVKMNFVVFFNLDKATKWSDETKTLNVLDSYTANRTFFENNMTEQQMKDKIKYHTLGLKDENLKNAVEEVIFNNPYTKTVAEDVLALNPEFKSGTRKIRKDITRLVDKISCNGLKGIVVESKTKFGVKITDPRYVHLNDFANSQLVISNKVQGKYEWGISVASGLQDYVSEAIKEGKDQFDFKFGKNIKGLVTKENMIPVTLTIEGIEYEAYGMITPVNVHESKNNYVAQGDSTIKQTLFNIQVNNGVRGNKSPWYFKNNKGILRSIEAAGYTPIFGEWKEADLDKVYNVSTLKEDGTADAYKISRFNLLKTKYQINKLDNNEEAELIFEAAPFVGNKKFVMNQNGDILEFVESDVPTEYVYIKERETISLSKNTVNKLYSEDEILSEEILMSRTGSEVKNITVLEALKLMSSKELSPLVDAYSYLGENFNNTIDKKTGEQTENLFGWLSKQRLIQIKGLNIAFEPSMKTISVFFSKELNTAIRAAVEAYADNTLDNFIELIDSKRIKNLGDFYEVLTERLENEPSLLNIFFDPKAKLVTKFDIEHNVNGIYVLKQDIKDKVSKLLNALNSMTIYHRERLFTKNANEAFFNKQEAFYGTVVAVDTKLDTLRINPNSQGVNKKMKEKEHCIFDRKPNTGEFGYGLKVIWDETVPENCVCVHPAILEQLMGDTDGDTAFVYFVHKSICKQFKHMDLDLERYFEIYDLPESKWFSKWNKNASLDMSYEAILNRNNEFRTQLGFNPEFVGRITAMNMILAEVVWKEFVVGKKDEELENGYRVYNFFINVVQKQLSQIPIAAKNTDMAGLEDFRGMMSNLNSLSNYEDYSAYVSSLDKEAKDFEEKKLALNSYAKFISVTGWDTQMLYNKELVSF